MSTQPWRVRDYDWCSCGARVINDGDTVCTMCAAHLRLSDEEFDDNEDTRDCG
jgi:hypothetical protein